MYRTKPCGECAMPAPSGAEKRRANEATRHMAANMGRNLVFYALSLKDRPLVVGEPHPV